ncbi:alpha/beta fold hydrolase [Pseudomonas sp. NCCP-436]|uniref:alpha/beta fold hydrolase n=1 Tax=Pseudomonas sp. NCCP-436 TaxID=2842481 RepID=UPI001C7EDF21|nr:alpha/beta fold hydrolase [Pseudomonas sp. NCCP-436]
MKKLLYVSLLLLIGGLAVLYCFPAVQWAGLQLLEQQRAGLSSRQLRVADLNIHYYQGGLPKGETLVLLHGFAADKDNWLRFSRHLTDRYQVIALDLPGFGASERPTGSYDVGTQAERLAGILDALQLERIHLLGHSMGGHIAALYAARYPERLNSLVLLANAGVDTPVRSEFFQILENGGSNPLIVRQPEDFARLLSFIFTEVPRIPERLRYYLGERAASQAEHHEQVFSHLVTRHIPLEPLLPRIQAPTLLLWGDHDRVLDISSLQVMQPLLGKVSVAVMPGIGHAPMLESAEECARIYRNFLQSLE